jgi:hypothetical protein
MFKFELTYEEISTGTQTVITLYADSLPIAKTKASEKLGAGYQYIRAHGTAYAMPIP